MIHRLASNKFLVWGAVGVIVYLLLDQAMELGFLSGLPLPSVDDIQYCVVKPALNFPFALVGWIGMVYLLFFRERADTLRVVAFMALLLVSIWLTVYFFC